MRSVLLDLILEPSDELDDIGVKKGPIVRNTFAFASRCCNHSVNGIHLAPHFNSFTQPPSSATASTGSRQPLLECCRSQVQVRLQAPWHTHSRDTSQRSFSSIPTVTPCSRQSTLQPSLPLS